MRMRSLHLADGACENSQKLSSKVNRLGSTALGLDESQVKDKNERPDARPILEQGKKVKILKTFKLKLRITTYIITQQRYKT